MNKIYEDISTQMIERYSTRLNKLGTDVKTLGWGSKEFQEYRFLKAIHGVDFSEPKSVLDIGSGFGDLLLKLISENKAIKKYIGWDLNPDLVRESINLWKESEIPVHFEVQNILANDSLPPVAEVGFMIGVLNLNLKNQIDNYDYSKTIIKNAFNAVSELLVVDFLSLHYDENYPKEDIVFYHDPLIMLEYAFTLTKKVKLVQNYDSIPQREFQIYLYK